MEYYCTIFAVTESFHDPNILWVGTDDGLVHITQDSGQNWTAITPKEMPEWSLISMIEASTFDQATAYLAVNRYKLDDFKPYIYKTTDFGITWKKITNGLPDNSFVRVVREDPARQGLLYADAVYVESAARYNDGMPIREVVLEPFDGIVLRRH